MKYDALKPEKRLCYELPVFNGGVNSYADGNSLLENQLTQCKNVWLDGGMLRNRKGIMPLPSTIVSDETNYNVLMGIQFTNTVFYLNNTPHTVAYCLRGDNYSGERLSIFLTADNGNTVNLQQLRFNRISEEEFYRFKNIFFTVGEKTRGLGLYAFLTRECSNYGKLFYVYELSQDLSEWIQLSEHDFYVPIVYINGRGNKYNESLQVFVEPLPEPISPENLNMLSGRFKAYYSSDEYSYEFKLPFKNLSDDSAIECKIYYSPNSYTSCVIKPGENEGYIPFYQAELLVYCNRAEGTIGFLDLGFQNFPIPKMVNIPINNIVIAASISAPNIEKIISSSGAKSFNSSVFLYGNTVTPNEVYCAKLNNPLYFAENMKTAVGEYGAPVSAIAVQQNKLIAFKGDEIYRINISDKKETSVSSLIDTKYNFFQSDKLSTTPVHLEIGCRYPKTVALCGNKLFWLGDKDRAYVLITTTYGKENNVYEISLPIKNELSTFSERELESAFSLEYDGYYMLFIANKVFLLDYKNKNFNISPSFSGLKDTPSSISWYIWEYPSSMGYTTALSLGERLLIGCTSLPKRKAFLSTDEGENDNILNANGTIDEASPIEIEFTTGKINFDIIEANKNINEIFIEHGGSSELKLEIIGQDTTLECTFPKSDKILVKRICPMLRGENSVILKFSSKNTFSLGKGKIVFQKTSNVR